MPKTLPLGLLPTLLLGLLIGLVEWPYQLLSALGFRLQQQLWPLNRLVPQPARLAAMPTAAAGPLGRTGRAPAQPP